MSLAKTLTEIRDAYVTRIGEYVAENREGLLSRARGEETWELRAEELFQAGEELRQISVLLSLLQPEPQQGQKLLIKPLSFALLAKQIQSNDLETAQVTLAQLLAIKQEYAATALLMFLNQCSMGYASLAHLEKISAALASGDMETSVPLLSMCFGFHTSESQQIASNIKALLQ